jgi:YebC/PmpR family DNA-binding regulatory protein
MSGHSKWSTIKRKKGAEDAKRGQLFTKIGRAITITASEGGGDPNANFVLRLAIDKARDANMPMENIERAIKRGTGEGDEAMVLEKAVYGGYGPGGVAIAVDVTTDNKNRTASDMRKIFSDHGGNMADASSVLWQFKEMGRVIVKCARLQKSEKYGDPDKEVSVDRDGVMMELMDVAGVEDVKEYDDGEGGEIEKCEVISQVKELSKVRDEIVKLGYIVEAADVVKIANSMQEIDEATSEKVLSLFEDLDNHDDVENIWVNAVI